MKHLPDIFHVQKQPGFDLIYSLLVLFYPASLGCENRSQGIIKTRPRNKQTKRNRISSLGLTLSSRLNVSSYVYWWRSQIYTSKTELVIFSTLTPTIATLHQDLFIPYSYPPR